MSVKDRAYYDSCPMCESEFLGYTASDMLEHIRTEHPHEAERLIEKLGIAPVEDHECPNCGLEYTSYGGADCPQCRGEGGFVP